MKKVIGLFLGIAITLSGISVSFAAETAENAAQNPEAATVSITSEETSGDVSGSEEKPESLQDREEAVRNDSPEKTSPAEDVIRQEEGTDQESAQETDQDQTQDEPDPQEEAPEAVISFDDVQNPTFYYYEPVYWAVQKGITEGTSRKEFSPDDSCTRGQMITFFWRAAGSPAPASAENPFQDIVQDAYYRDAVLWAVEQGLTQGMTKETFAPEDACTRAQCVTFLQRFKAAPDDGFRVSFADVPDNAYYAASLSWAMKNGITNGFPDSTFRPDDLCNRAQTMTFFYRSMIVQTEKELLPIEDQPVAGFELPEVNGKTGEFVLRMSGFSGISEIKDAQVAIWTKEDQSDLRWFSMKPAADGTAGVYETTQNIESFGRSSGDYHASLYLVTTSGEQMQRIHMEDSAFEVSLQNYMYTEDLGVGRIRVTVQGVAPEIESLQIIAWDQSNGSGAYTTVNAVNQSEGLWAADIDMLTVLDSGVYGLTAVNTASDEELNVITKTIHVKKVIDVSQYQGSINWAAAKESGMFEAALIRCGLRSSKGKCVADTRFTYNASSCAEQNIPMGFYWFTSAMTVAEAIQEADYCARLIAPYHVSYPVFVDSEQGGRSGLNRLENEIRTNCVLAFMERMEEYGYETGIYASSSWYKYNLNYSRLKDRNIWVASWSGRPTYVYDGYIGWQYNVKTRIPGITQNTTDMSYWFK